MQRKEVESSNIASIGYDPPTLEVEFHHGGVYTYEGVPQEVYENFMAAPSKGRFFAENIKGKYPHQRV
jgi:hypothetical protein